MAAGRSGGDTKKESRGTSLAFEPTSRSQGWVFLPITILLNERVARPLQCDDKPNRWNHHGVNAPLFADDVAHRLLFHRAPDWQSPQKVGHYFGSVGIDILSLRHPLSKHQHIGGVNGGYTAILLISNDQACNDAGGELCLERDATDHHGALDPRGDPDHDAPDPHGEAIRRDHDRGLPRKSIQ